MATKNNCTKGACSGFINVRILQEVVLNFRIGLCVSAEALFIPRENCPFQYHAMPQL